MSRLLFNRSNKSQASLDRTSDIVSPAPLQVQQVQPDTAYSTSHFGGAAHPHSHSHPHPSHGAGTSASAGAGAHPSAQQQYLLQQQQQHPPRAASPYQQSPESPYYEDRGYHQHQQHQQSPAQPSQVLGRSHSHRLPSNPPNPYQEQQGLNNTRPTVNIVAPDTIREDDHLQPGKTYFGSSQTRHVNEPKDSSKKSKTSRLFGLVSGAKDKDKDRDKGSPPDHNRLSRTGSVLKRSQQQQQQQQQQQSYPSSPQYSEHTTSPNQPSSQSIAAHLEESESSDNLPGDREGQYEDYYRGQQQRGSQYNSPLDTSRPPLQYQEDTHHFPPPPHPGTQQHLQFDDPRQQNHPPSQHPYQVQADEPEPQFFPYPTQQGQPGRGVRPSVALLQEQQSLRPPSQSSLGPPSPLAESTQPQSSRPATSSTQRYSTQTAQTYHQQTIDPHQAHEAPAQSERQAIYEASADYEPSELDQEMPDRSQRKSRLPEDNQDPRHNQAQDPRLRMSTQQEQGRSTPPPRRGEDISSLDHQQLVQRYEELSAKYSKVKRYYFEREAQVTQLQNTVANQRLSMSKTSLDDAQYTNRFERLSGAIQNIAFNIRKDWRRMPNWLAPACNRDACQVGTKEMTAVGRACISRWLYEHVFQEIFHPGLDPHFSSQLKQMERALRRTPSVLTDDQRDDLLTKVTTWRLTTCEALYDTLNSRESEANIDGLARYLAQQLYEHLLQYVNEPQAGLADNLLTIVGQALSIASNLPLESRDICIEYFFPGTPLSDTYMKVESGMTPLTNPGSAPTAEEPPTDESGTADEDSMKSTTPENPAMNVEDAIREAFKSGTTTGGSSQTALPTSATKSADSHKKKSSGGMLSSLSGGLVGGSKSSSRPQQGPGSTSKSSSGDSKDSQAGKDAKDDDDHHAWNIDSMTRGHRADKIRFAVFLAVEVRGKAAKGEGDAQNGTGNGGAGNDKGAGSAGPGQGPANGAAGNGGTSGGVGTGGVNVLCKAPVYGF